MMTRTVVIAILSAVLLMALVLELVRRRRLRIGYSLLWLLTGATILFLVLFRQVAGALSSFIGVEVPTSLIFAAGIVLSLLILLEHSLTLTTLWRQDKSIAQHQALLEWQIRELRDRLEEVEALADLSNELTDDAAVPAVQTHSLLSLDTGIRLTDGIPVNGSAAEFKSHLLELPAGTPVRNQGKEAAHDD